MSGRSFELAPGPATFGRGLQNNYIIPDDSVSTEHLLVMSGPGQCRIKDRNTSNGTFVNGERVTQAALKHGDELKIGEVLVSVEMEVREAPRPGGAMKQAKKRALPDVNMAELAAAVRAGRPGAKAKQTQNAAAKKRAASGPTFDEVASDYVPEVRRKRIILPFGSILVWGCLVSLMVAGVWQFFFSKKVEVVVAPPPIYVDAPPAKAPPPPTYAAAAPPPPIYAAAPPAQAPASPPSSMTQMMVTLPAGMMPGQQLQVQSPNGQSMTVTVPEGVYPGGQFGVMLPAA